MAAKKQEVTPDYIPAQERFTGNNARASWQFSLHNVRANMSHCTPQYREAMISAFLWCTDEAHPVFKRVFAERIGYSDNVIYKVYTGKYRNPDGSQLDIPKKMADAAKTFVNLEKERYIGKKTDFVTTPTSQKITNACDLARESQTPVFVYGHSHTGKTIALQQYTSNNNHGHTIYVRMKAACGLGGMVKRIASRCGISENSNTASLIDRIKNALTPDMLLIIDEAHLLQYTYRKQSFFACMEVIREIYDEVKCGMVLCGTILMLDKLNEGSHGEMEQLLRRGVHRISVAITRHDIAAIVKHTGLVMPKAKQQITVQGIVEEPYAILKQLSKTSGLLAINERLRYASKIAARSKQQLSWDNFVEAHLTIAAGAKNEEW